MGDFILPLVVVKCNCHILEFTDPALANVSYKAAVSKLNGEARKQVSKVTTCQLRTALFQFDGKCVRAKTARLPECSAAPTPLRPRREH